MRRPIRSREQAETLSLQALAFLASEPDRLEPFLAITGLGPETLRAAAQEPGFLGAVLAHLCDDESLLLAFAANAGLDPAMVVEARHALAGEPAGDSD